MNTNKTKTVKTPACRFTEDTQVKLNYRVDPFLADEILSVDTIQSNKRSGKNRQYRIRVVSIVRNVSGWVDEEALELV